MVEVEDKGGEGSIIEGKNEGERNERIFYF